MIKDTRCKGCNPRRVLDVESTRAGENATLVFQGRQRVQAGMQTGRYAGESLLTAPYPQD